MLAGVALLVTAVRLSTPSLVLFLVGGALIGAGAAAPEERVAMTSTLIITALFGLSIPVVGAGVALSQGVSAANTVLGFGTAVALGVALSGWALLRTNPRPSSPPGAPTSTPRSVQVARSRAR
jgi:hypothetical protein